MAEARHPDTTFWVEPASIRGEHLTLSREESHHLVRVHRASAGTPFTAIDGAGTAYECVVESMAGDVVTASIAAREPERGELPLAIALIVGLPDAGPAETVVEHAVPLGARRIDFVVCARSGRQALGEGKLERLDRIARAGAKQSRRCRSALVTSSASLEEAIEALGPGPRFVADPRGAPAPPEAMESSQAMISLAVGPPGGFDRDEEARLTSAGFHSISLGPSRLTTETASIALFSVIRNWLLRKGLGQI